MWCHCNDLVTFCFIFNVNICMCTNLGEGPSAQHAGRLAGWLPNYSIDLIHNSSMLIFRWCMRFIVYAYTWYNHTKLMTSKSKSGWQNARWCHGIETILAICERVPLTNGHRWRVIFIFFLAFTMCWTNGCVAGDSRCVDAYVTSVQFLVKQIVPHTAVYIVDTIKLAASTNTLWEHYCTEQIQ